MIGPLPTVPGGFTHILVAVDKFTKWIEVKPIKKISSDRAVEFISEILHRFGFPNRIITDLGSNFTSQEFWDYCENSCIDVKYVSVAHPRANGQVERINGLIIEGLKKRIFDSTSRTTNGNLGSTYPTQQGNRTNSFLPGIRLRSNTTGRRNVEVTSSRDV